MRLTMILTLNLLIWSAAFGQSLPTEFRIQTLDKVPREFETVIASPLNQSVSYGSKNWCFQDSRLGTGQRLAQLETSRRVMWLQVKFPNKATCEDTVSVKMTPNRPAQGVLVQKKSSGWQFTDHGRPVLLYHAEPQSKNGNFTRAGFVHPLMGLDGEVLTQVFPDDHKHHHGVFWAWHQFLVAGKPAGDPWETRDFLAVVKRIRVIDQGPLFATLVAEVDWTSPAIRDASGQPVALVRELTKIQVFHAIGSSQYVDFDIRLRALVDDVELGGADNVKGYSGFTVRVAPPAGMSIYDENGALLQDRIGRTSRWAQVTGQFRTNVERETAISGLAILSHPELAEFPPKWLLRFYGMQNVVYPGRNRIRLDKHSDLRLRHRLVIHRGDHGASQVEKHQVVYELTL